MEDNYIYGSLYDEVNGVPTLLNTEDYVAKEMYKIFLTDNPTEFAKVRKQILKHQRVDYFKNSNRS